jgi:hypothetical protein
MALSVRETGAIAGVVAIAAPGVDPVAALRLEFPGLMVSRCDALDMRDETPFHTTPTFDLYLVDTSSHCWRVVVDPNEASGVIVASRA